MKKILIVLYIFLICHQAHANGYEISTGNDSLTNENIAKITEGTSQREVLSILGEPQTKMQIPSSGELWVYSHAAQSVKMPGFFNIFSSPKTSVNAKSVSIMFGENGLVKTCSTCTNNQSLDYKMKKI